MRFNPNIISGLKDSEPPCAAAELCEYVHGVGWISNSVSRLSWRVAPLRALLVLLTSNVASSPFPVPENAVQRCADLSWNSFREHFFWTDQLDVL